MEIEKILKCIKQKYRNIAPFLNERGRRIWVGIEAKSLGYGGQRLVHQATGISINTIRKGIKELRKENDADVEKPYIRASGGGRKSYKEKDKTLKRDIMNIVESSTRGDPEAALLWCSKSLRKIADELNKKEPRVSHTHIAKILTEEGYSLQANRKVNEGSNNTDSDK